MKMDQEIEYWRQLTVAPSRDSQSHRNTQYIVSYLTDYLAKSLLDLQQCNPRDGLDILETVDLQLTELWKQKDSPFPEQRMRTLFGLFENGLITMVRKASKDVVSGSTGYREAEEHLSDCLALCNKWIGICHALTVEVWPELIKNAWTYPPVMPDLVLKLKTRINEVASIRGVVNDTISLVGRLEKPTPLESCTEMEVLDVSAANDAKWSTALRTFDTRMERYEYTIAGNLKTKFHNNDAGALQMLMEFRKCRSVIARPKVKSALTAEREMLLNHMTTILAGYEEEYAADKSEIFDNHTRTISNIIWTRQLVLKIRELDSGLETALGDLPKFAAFLSKLKSLKERAEQRIPDRFDGWSTEVSRSVKNPTGPMSLNIGDRLMDIEQPSGRLVVNFSDQLVTLIKEVRYLESIGLLVPEAIKERYSLAKKFYDSGIVLMQVAHFYNTIDQQMINCQKPMLIESAKRFEKVIRSVKGGKSGTSSSSLAASDVRWSDMKRVEDYVNQVHDATLALTQENRRLRSLHQKAILIIQQLADTNLVQKVAEWKRLLNEIHKIFASVAVESQRYPAENITPWRLHIDHQIRKALDIQLRRCLLSLADSLPEMQVDMVYRNYTLQYRPSIHQIRENFSLELQKLFSLPSTLKPLSEINEKRDFFRQVVQDCHLEVALAQRNLEFLLVQLERVLHESRQYVVLGSVDIVALVEARVVQVEDWEREFKSLKQRSRTTEQIPLQVKVQNVTVNFGPVRTAIDGLIQDTQDALVNALRKSILLEVDGVSAFVGNANQVLSRQPATTEELASLSGDFHQLLRDSEQMKPRLSSIEEKNNLLKSSAGRGVDKSENMLRTWNTVLSMLDDHKSVMKDQTSLLQERVQKDIKLFEKELEKFEARWLQARPSEDRLDDLTVLQIKQVSETVNAKRQDLEALIKRRNDLTAQCTQLGMQAPTDGVLEKITTDLNSCDVTWKELLDFSQDVETLSQEDWLTFRNKLYKLEDLLKVWNSRMQASRPTAFTLRIQKEITTYRAILPGLKACRGEAFSEEHWAEIFAILQLKSVNIEQLTLAHLLTASSHLLEQSDQIKDLSARAQAEVSIREALRELEIWGAAAVFHLTSYSDAAGTQVQIVKDWSDLLAMVGERQRLLQSTKDSQHYGKFSDRMAIWEQRLLDLSFLLDNLHQVQRRWVYLEPIYSRNSLPNEESRFRKTDADLRGILKEIAREPRLVGWMRPALKTLLPALLDQLQRCQKALNDFLEAKRLAFPRFYFIGDEDLLEIVGQSANPKVLQAHLKKLFAGVHSVQFSGDSKQIVAVQSPEGEALVLKSPVGLIGSVEIWLAALSEELKRSLRLGLRDCLNEPTGKDLALLYPSQVQRLAEHIKFTTATEAAIRGQKLAQLHTGLQSKLNKLTEQQRKSGENVVLLSSLQGLILDTIHHLDIVGRLVDAKVSALDNWLWQKQLRFYAEADASVSVRIVDAQFKYSFEYQGCLTGLVHTQLTDKCFLTLTQAMQMGFGGNPYGPAGTGKTESVKELGANLGRQVLVFNCDEGIDARSMGRIFVGLLKCGAWGCFDEFNRLDELTMSAISMQVLAIQAALQDSSQQLELLDRKIDINRDAGIFITLNPASKGYGGRQKLPDNLKQLFRPIAMTVPDAERIAEVLFQAEGFQHGKVMGQKLVVVYASARQLLSRQRHYDWGLRALKSTIQMAGRFLAVQKTSLKNTSVQSSPDEESMVVVQAIQSNILSKLTVDDRRCFLDLLRAGFPGDDQKQAENGLLERALAEAFGQMGLIASQNQVEKAIELRDQLAQRIGVVVVGPAASGKTTLWRLLHAAMLHLKIPLKYHVINPTAMPKTQLLGSVDEATREWSDGVLTKCVREVLAESAESAAWIVCDGDIDPDWIESLNSVLDDNRLLTLPSGERLRFPANVNLLFETNDLTAASPATVSRMGMIFMSPDDVSLKTVVEAWLLKQPNETIQGLTDFTKDTLYNAVKKAASLTSDNSNVSKIELAGNALSLLEGCTHRTEMMAALVQGIGGALVPSSQDKYAAEILKAAGYDPPDLQRPFNVYYDSEAENLKAVRIPQVSAASATAIASFDQLPVFPCVSQRLAVLRIKAWLLQGKDIFVKGSAGWGKSVVLNLAFSEAAIKSVLAVECTSTTAAPSLITKLARSCLSIPTAKGRIMRPKNTDRLVVVVNNIHVVKKDRWGHGQFEAFLRQIISQGGFFDETSEWVQLDGIQLIVTADAGGKAGVSGRLTSIMRTTELAEPDVDDQCMVASGYFQALVTAQCNGHLLWSKAQNVEKLAKTVVTVLNKCRDRFSRDKHPHYGFTLKDLVGCIMALFRYKLQDQSGVLLLTALCYEMERTFSDGLTSSSDRAQFDAVISGVLKNEWASISVDREGLFAGSALQEGSTGTIDGAPMPELGRTLSKISLGELKLMVNTAVRQINRDSFALEVYVHDALLDGVRRVENVLGQPGGSVVLLGPSGYGRRTVALVAVKLQLAVFIKLRLVRGYSLKQFKVDIKRVIDFAAVKNENVVLLLEDLQLANPLFVEIVTSLRACGECAGLYSEEERDKLNSSVADQMSQEGFDGSADVFLAHRIGKNFHCIITLDNSASRCLSLCQRIPSLTQLFRVVWMDSLPEATLLSICSSSVVATSPSEEAPPVPPESSQTSQRLTLIHRSSPPELQSSARFYRFLQTFRTVKHTMLSTIQSRTQRLQQGLDQLIKARTDVMNLKRTVTNQHAALTNKQEEAKNAMDDIRESMSGANTQKEQVTLLKADLQTERAKLVERENAIAAELADVLPILENAKAAVNKIKNTDLSEIKSLRAPPTVIHNILEGVLKLFGNKDTSWSGMRAFLTPGVKEEIIHFDTDKVSREHLRLTQALVEKNKSSFDEETAKRASAAAAPLAAWVKACVKYAEVHEKIAPLAAEKRKLESTIEMHAMRVTNADQDIGKLSSRIDLLQARFQKLSEEAAVMKIQLSLLTEKLQVAEVLVEKLESEYTRWSTQLKESSQHSQTIEINAILASGFITYLTACSEDDRTAYITQWCEKFQLGSFDFLSQLTTEAERLEWRANGLPSDALSMENAVILFHSSMPCLIIDPAGSVVDWLKKSLNNKTVEVCDQEDNNFQSILELAIRFGKSLIVEVSDVVDPVLVPLLRRDLIRNGARMQVEMGDRLIDYHAAFALHLVTRNSSIALHPQTAALVNVVSFTATRAGLANQLLSLVVECKLPDVERRRRQLLQEQEALKIKLTQLEDSLLTELANSQGNLLENSELRESLNRTKASAEVAEKNLEEGRKVKETLDRDQAVFQVLATKCCSVHFALQSLAKLNVLYRFSLATFVGIYRKAVENLAKDDQMKDQLQKFCAVAFYQVIHYVYAHVNRSIYKRDHLTCLLQFIKIVRPELIKEPEWNFLLASEQNQKSTTALQNLPNWLNSSAQASLSGLSKLIPDTSAVLQLEDQSVWKTFLSHPQCETVLPGTVKITPFQQVLVIKALRPDRLISALSMFLAKSLKLPDLATDTSLKAVWDESTADVPILIVTSAGTDPSLELVELATNQGHIVNQIAMGLQETDRAVHAIQEAAAAGTWVSLKNLHLIPLFFQRLTKEIKALKPLPSYRLWLTTESADVVPVFIVETALKVVCEAPPGVKQNILRTMKESNEQMKLTASAPPTVLLVLFWFHAVVQERRNYVPLGWTKFYEFSTSDLRAAMRFIGKYGKATPGRGMEDYIRGLLEDVVYGGRVDTPPDLRILSSYIQAFFGENVGLELFGKTSPRLRSTVEFLEDVQKLPETDASDVLGLPANIDGSHQKTESLRVFQDLQRLHRINLLESAVTAADGEWIHDIDSLYQFCRALRKNIEESIPSTTETAGNSLASFFGQELAFALELVRMIYKTLTMIRQHKSWDTVGDGLKDTARSILAHETPEGWLTGWNGSSRDPMEYLKNIQDLVGSCQTQLKTAAKESGTGLRVDVRNVFHPDILVAALRLLAARESGVGAEQLYFHNEWSLDRLKSVPYVVSLTGIHIEGALLERDGLRECQYDSPTSSLAPTCYVAWINKGSGNAPTGDKASVDLPVYCDSSREEVAFNLTVPCQGHPSHWIRLTAAFILRL